MKDVMNPKKWAAEFKDFAEASPITPPAHLREAIFSEVHRDLHPSLLRVLAKLGLIHAFVGALSLQLCSQFGMGHGNFIMRSFMGYGMPVCMAFCGALFLGLTTLVAGLILTNSELKKIRRTAYAPIWALGMLSLVVFLNFGAGTATSFAAFWFLGAVLAGVVLTEGSIVMRKVLRFAA